MVPVWLAVTYGVGCLIVGVWIGIFAFGRLTNEEQEEPNEQGHL